MVFKPESTPNNVHLGDLKMSVASIFTARHVASAVVLPGVFAGMLVFAAPAGAAGSSTSTGVCNGITNQIGSRGTFQPNLLKAAAKQNAAVIQQLQLKRAGLVTQSGSLTSQITTAEREIAELDKAAVLLDGQIAASQARLTGLTESQTEVNRLIGLAEDERDQLATDRAVKELEYQAAEVEVTDAQDVLEGLRADKAENERLVGLAQGELTAANTALNMSVQAAVAAQQAVDAQQEAIGLATDALADAVEAGDATAQAVIDAQQDLDDATEALAPLVDAAAEATRLAGEAQTDVNTAGEQLTELRTAAMAADDAIAPAQQAFDAAVAAEQGLEEAVGLKQAEIDAKQLELDAARETDGGTVTTLTNDPAVVQAEIDRLKAERDALDKSANNQRGEYHAKIKQLEDTRTLTTTQIIDNTAKIDTLTQDLQVLNGQLETLNDDLSQAGIESAARQEELETAQNNLKLADEAVETQLLVIEGLEDVRDEADTAATAAAAEVTAQREEIERLTQALATAEGIDETAQALIGTLTEDLAELDEDLLLKEAARDDADDAVDAATEARDALVTEISRLEGAVEGLMADIAAQEDVISDLEDAAGVLLGELQALDGQITQNELDLAALRQDLSDLGDDIAAEEEILAGLESQLADNDQAVEDKQALVTSLEQRNAAVLAEIEAIDAQLSAGGCVV